jgi:DNA polymerase III delta subunit
MIYLFHGNNYSLSSTKARNLSIKLREKRPDATLVTLWADSINKDRLEECIKGQGLFVEKLIVRMQKVCDNKDIVPELKKRLPEIKKSNNIFIFVESSISAGLLSQFKKNAEKVIESNAEIKEREKREALFSLTDALGARRAKHAWVLLEKAYMAGHTPDDIHPLLFWQIKTILMVKTLKNQSVTSAERIGIKSYSFRKAQNFAKNFTDEELKKLSQKLVDIHNRARSGKIDLDLGLLEFVLSL